MSEVITVSPEKKSPRFKLILIAILVAFLIGFVPMWVKERTAASTREKAEHELTLVRMVKDLGAATIDARRAEYEAARVEASAFFTAARFEIDQGKNSAFTEQQRNSLLPLLEPRDTLITLLARSDPASADRLSALFVNVRKVLGV